MDLSSSSNSVHIININQGDLQKHSSGMGEFTFRIDKQAEATSMNSLA